MARVECRYLTVKEVAELIGVDRSAIYRCVKAGTFPVQHRLGPGERGKVSWLKSEVEAWIAQRERASKDKSKIKLPGGKTMTRELADQLLLEEEIGGYLGAALGSALSGQNGRSRPTRRQRRN
jgi:excisionase family DNA binding protein